MANIYFSDLMGKAKEVVTFRRAIKGTAKNDDYLYLKREFYQSLTDLISY